MGRRFVLCLAVICVSAFVTGAALSSVSSRPARVPTAPVPAARILSARTAAPPDTNSCLMRFGVRCYQPAQLLKAYDVTPLHKEGIDGDGRTIVVVDSFGSPTIRNDLHVFDQTFGLPDPPGLDIIQPVGAAPPFDPHNPDMVGWAAETTLDVEWAHVMAPEAKILLVETPVSETEGVQGFPEIVAAENFVIDRGLGDVISQSFGTAEETFRAPGVLLGLRSSFENARRHHVTVLASTGDTGATNPQLNIVDLFTKPVVSWPSSDPLVTAVGGTKLTLDTAGNRLAPDVVWNDFAGATGGGLSSVFRRPAFQDHVKSVVDGRRGTPDVSMSASITGAVIIYSSFGPGPAGYDLIAGTSASAPMFAGIVAMADQLAGHRLGWLNPRLYRLHGGIVDVTQGNNTFGPFRNTDGKIYTVPGYAAGPGYDLASGLGTIDAVALVPELARRDLSDDQVNDQTNVVTRQP